MKIAIAATNPCHLYPLAVELSGQQALDCYYSGYPKWKLAAHEIPIRTHSFRTNIVYGMLKYFPDRWRPASRDLFLWQDRGFDEWVGRTLRNCDFIHAMPGQSLRTFMKAKSLGARTVLNHATGPVREWVRIMEPEYERAGMKLTDICPYDDPYFERESQEYALAELHCVASTIVRDQLIDAGVDPGKIWVIPYGADCTIFFPRVGSRQKSFGIVFAGQAGLRKGIPTLLRALEIAGPRKWNVDFYGVVLDEVKTDLSKYRGTIALNFHGAVSQPALASAFRSGSVLVLPSLEEGFGLVVPQALNTGLPCIVSDRVGAKDLIRHRENGSIFRTQDPDSLLQELLWWEENDREFSETLEWKKPAETLISVSRATQSKR